MNALSLSGDGVKGAKAMLFKDCIASAGFYLMCHSVSATVLNQSIEIDDCWMWVGDYDIKAMTYNKL